MVRESKKLSVVTLAFLVFATKFACVEDLLSEDTCNWICKAETGELDAKELQKMISQGNLLKLKFVYEERVEGTCANRADTSDTSEAALKVWFVKMASDLSQTILGGIYSSEFVFGAYKEMSVSCIYRSTTTPATNHSTQRLAFHSPHSVMYYVEQLANYTYRNATFLTLIRINNQTHINVGVTGTSRNSSLDSAKELIVTDGWLFVSVLIWIGFVLYSPVVLLLFRPSEAKVHVTRKSLNEREDEQLPLPVQNEDDDIKATSHEDHAEENEEDVRGGDSSDSRAGILGIAAATSLDLPENWGFIPIEDETNESERSEMVLPRSTCSTYEKKPSTLLVPLANPKKENNGKDVDDGEIDKQSFVVSKDSQDPACNSAASGKDSFASTSSCAAELELSGDQKTRPIGIANDRMSSSKRKRYNVPTSHFEELSNFDRNGNCCHR